MFDQVGQEVKPEDGLGTPADPAGLSDDDLDRQMQALWAHIHVAATPFFRRPIWQQGAESTAGTRDPPGARNRPGPRRHRGCGCRLGVAVDPDVTLPGQFVGETDVDLAVHCLLQDDGGARASPG